MLTVDNFWEKELVMAKGMAPGRLTTLSWKTAHSTVHGQHNLGLVCRSSRREGGNREKYTKLCGQASRILIWEELGEDSMVKYIVQRNEIN